MNKISAFWRAFVFLGLMVVALTPAGCGWVQWPPNGYAPVRPSRPGDSSLFTGASAVKVGRGDTVYALSRRHHVSVRAIISANRLRPPYHLKVGQRITLPRVVRHRVKKGETLYAISRSYRVDAYVLARANALKSPYVIHVGQRLRIPRSGSVIASVARPGARPSATTPRKSLPPIPPPPSTSGKGFSWPLKGRIVSSFGAKEKGFHNDGINIVAPQGSPVKVAENGVVAYAGNELRGFGNLLLVKHKNGWVTAYAHNASLMVRRGQKVKKGQLIAKVGKTGSVRTPQLHFEIRKGKRALDPKKYLRGSV
jgi:murein DD-endopeptidase MepM/ murein hydrolase activator NlpD